LAVILIAILSFFNQPISFAQNASNPVQVTSNLTPPYSLYLSDYSDASQNKWNIQLLLKDFTQTNYQAKLRITIEGAGIRLRTRQGFSAGPIRLDPGLPYQVDATDLSQYLNIQNMEVSGINRNQLASTQKLPEGFYQFKIEVLDYNRNNRVSNIGTSMAWLVLNDPPLLNLPFEEKLRIQDPQQVQFQWTPRHTSSPNSAFETEYIFRLWEIWPEGRNPNEVARTTQPLFERTIMTTSYFYGLNDAMLIPGRSYAWQVQAINLTGRDLFKNQGKSEVRWFKYGDECLPITNLGAEALGTDRIRITWEGKWNHNQFVAQIRKTGEEEWISYGTNIETQVVYDLEANTEYQIRVLPSCGAIEGTVENTLTLSTPEQNVEDFDCGADADLPTIENREPIEQLQIGDRITAAGFTVILTELNQIGDTYTGMGFIEVPLFNSARVEAILNDIQVNTDKQLIGGTVESTLNPNGPFILDMDPDEELSEEGTGEQTENAEDSFDDLPETDLDIEGEIADVEYNESDSTITVTDTEGNTTEIDPETADENEDGDIVIEDDNGNVYVVGDDGEVSGPYNDNPSNPDALPEDATIDYVVQFKASPQQEYGFDSKQYETLAGNYTQTTLNGETYWMAWKSIPTGISDPVLAEVTGTDEFPEAVGFKNLSTNLGFAPGEEANEKSVSVQTSTEEEEVTAFVFQERTNAEGEIEEEQVTVGKLKVKQYEPISNKVVVVPVNDAEVPAASSLQQELNQIYGQAVASWDLNIAEPYEVSSGVLESLNEGESGWLASFPQNMRQFNRDYKRSVEFDSEAYYLFVINEEVADIAGFMPFKRQYGYIYSSNTNNLSKTIAHELGHGAFRLYHTFSNEAYVAARNATENLMDYNEEGTDLYKHQWDLVHDPENMVGWLEDDEEGEMGMFCRQFVTDLLDDINQINKNDPGIVNSAWSGEMVDCEVIFDFELRNSDITLPELYFETTLSEDVDIDFYSDVYKKTELSIYDEMENDYVRFDFGDYDVDDEALPIYSFIVLKEDAEDFEDYLTGTYLNINDESIFIYFISHDDAWLRINEDPYDFISPTEKAILGTQTALKAVVNDGNGNEVAHLIKKEDEQDLFITNSDEYLNKVESLSEEKEFIVVENYKALSLPFSNVQTTKTFNKNDEVTAYEICGDYYRIKSDETTKAVEGFWVHKSVLMKPLSQEELDLIPDYEEIMSEDVAEDYLGFVSDFRNDGYFQGENEPLTWMEENGLNENSITFLGITINKIITPFKEVLELTEENLRNDYPEVYDEILNQFSTFGISSIPGQAQIRYQDNDCSCNPSNHSLGAAIDIRPSFNPYIIRSNNPYIEFIKYMTGLDLGQSKTAQEVIAAQNEFMDKLHGEKTYTLDEIIEDYNKINAKAEFINQLTSLNTESIEVDDFSENRSKYIEVLEALKSRMVFENNANKAIDDMVDHLQAMTTNTIEKTTIANWGFVITERNNFLQMVSNAGFSDLTKFIEYFSNTKNRQNGNILLEYGFGEMRIELVNAFHKAHREIYKKYKGIAGNGEWGGTYNNKYDGMHFGLESGFIKSLTNE
jgi:hypothetical protein